MQAVVRVTSFGSLTLETPGYAHVWGYWRKSLADVAPRLFR
jgi:hypothetical protein